MFSKYLLLFAFLGLSLSTAYAQNRMFFSADAAYAGDDTAQNLVFVDATKGDNRTVANQTEVYVPLRTGANQENYCTFTPVPDARSASGPEKAIVGLTVYHDYATDRNVYFATKQIDGRYKIIEASVGPPTDGSPVVFPGTNAEVQMSGGEPQKRTLYIKLGTSGGCQGSCTYPADNDSTSTTQFNIYVFSTDTGTILPIGDTQQFDTVQNDGIFFEVRLSARIINTAPDLIDLRPGDGQLIAQINSSAVNPTNGVYKTQYFIYRTDGGMPVGGIQGAQTLSAATSTPLAGTLRGEVDPVHPAGIVVIPDLENNIAYNIGIAQLDRYNLSSLVSASQIETPKQIAAFLEEHQCYLISAGFKREHYVLRFFKRFRDQILLQLPFGSSLVNFYYRTASDYAPWIAENRYASGFMRFLAYLLYFGMRFLWIPFILGVCLLLYRRAQRSRFQTRS